MFVRASAIGRSPPPRSPLRDQVIPSPLGPWRRDPVGSFATFDRALPIHNGGMNAGALALVLASLSGLHIYWALGGEWAMSVVIPDIDGQRSFTPSRFATVLVAIGLAAAGVVPLVRTGVLQFPAPSWLSQSAAGLLAVIFFVRAVGDFRLVGFFKRVRGTAFARWDTFLFSPLCLLLAIGFVRLAAA